LCDAFISVVDGDEQREANTITGISDGSGVSSNESTSGNRPGATTEHMNRNKSVEAERLKYFKRLAVTRDRHGSVFQRSRHHRDLSGCIICRLRHKRCGGPEQTGACRGCTGLNIDCLRGYGLPVPRELRDERVIQLIKQHTKRLINRVGPPLQLAQYVTTPLPNNVASPSGFRSDANNVEINPTSP